MKDVIIVSSLILCCFLGYAQECSTFYPMREGVSLEYTSYDKKGKEAAVVQTKVTDVREEDGMQVATMTSIINDDKDKNISETSYDVFCDGDKLSIDFNSLVSPAMLEQYKEMDVEITGTNIDIPNTLSVGQDLPDASMLMNISMAGIPMKMTMDITDRKVEAQEFVTTSAGTYDCYVITYTSSMKMGMKSTNSGKQWIAEGVGLVKQEDYNKKGKITSSTVLTAYIE